MNDEQRLLASAVLDDAATSDERARATADPEVRAEIERLRSVRAQLRTGIEPDPTRREATIAAALAAFDAGRHDAVVAPAATSVGARRRARWLAPLAAAAALVVIVVGAVVAGRNDDELDDAAAPPTELPTAATDDRDASAAAEEAPAAATAGEGRAGAPPSSDASESADQLVATAPATEVLRTPEDLAAFAQRRLTLDAPAAGDNSACAVGTPLGSAFFVVGGEEVPVAVFEVEGSAVAVDPADCSVVARAVLP
jgi:hypothetical protein